MLGRRSSPLEAPPNTGEPVPGRASRSRKASYRLSVSPFAGRGSHLRFVRSTWSLRSPARSIWLRLFYAIKRATSDDREGVRDALGATRGFQGVTGKMTMGADRNPEMDVVIARVDGGRFRFQSRVRSVSAP